MDLQEVHRSWDEFGRRDPMWAVLTHSDKMGGRWDPEAFFATGVRDIDLVMRELEEMGVRPDPMRALDFGCAVGRLTQALAPRFDAVVGVDIAPSMLEQARQVNRFDDRCRYVLNTDDHLRQFPDASFSFVLSLITLQHVEPRYSERYLAEFLRVLEPGGVLVFQMPSHPETGYRIRTAAKRLVPEPILYAYRRARYGEAYARDPDQNQAMEMFGIPRARVEALLDQNQGDMVRVSPDARAGNWVGYRYVVRKRGQTPPRPAAPEGAGS